MFSIRNKFQLPLSGGEENPSASRAELIQMIKEVKLVPVERGTLFKVLETF